jgi:hypothetical protein
MILLNSMRGATIAEKAHQLNLAGFTNVEIADFLQTTAPVIAQSLYSKRKTKSKKKKK